MKKIFFILLMFIAASAHAQDDAIGRFFNKYLDDPRFTVVSVSPRMFRLMAKVNWDTVSQDLKQTVSHLQSFRILTTDSMPKAFFRSSHPQHRNHPLRLL